MPDYNTPAELKSLTNQIAKIEADIEIMTSEISNKQKELSKIKNKLSDLKKRHDELIDNSLTHEPIVSEHAILRYLERVNGVDIRVIIDEIMDDTTKSTIKFMKNGKIKRDNYTIVVKNKVVVSIT